MLITLVSVTSFAESAKINKGKALKALIDESSFISLQGDVLDGEKIESILEPLKDFLRDGVADTMTGEHEQLNSAISNVTLECENLLANELNCNLMIQNKGAGETNLNFKLDYKNNKINGLSNYAVYVSRGD